MSLSFAFVAFVGRAAILCYSHLSAVSGKMLSRNGLGKRLKIDRDSTFPECLPWPIHFWITREGLRRVYYIM